MNELIIWVLILIVCIILYVINHFYVFRKTCSVKLCDSDIRYKKCSPILGTGNGLGISLYGGARYDSKTGSEVYYQFVTILLPVLPIKCYLAKKTAFHRENHKKATTSYKIYGTVKWNIWEILFIYLFWYSFIGGVISIIGIACCLL